jgi:hypothetical protein
MSYGLVVVVQDEPIYLNELLSYASIVTSINPWVLSRAPGIEVTSKNYSCFNEL